MVERPSAALMKRPEWNGLVGFTAFHSAVSLRPSPSVSSGEVRGTRRMLKKARSRAGMLSVRESGPLMPLAMAVTAHGPVGEGLRRSW